ncbi:protein of unknown function [Thauera humireducens]|nr:protein of unknown function [Thauera humireducens]
MSNAQWNGKHSAVLLQHMRMRVKSLEILHLKVYCGKHSWHFYPSFAIQTHVSTRVPRRWSRWTMTSANSSPTWPRPCMRRQASVLRQPRSMSTSASS